MLVIKLGDRETSFQSLVWHLGDPIPHLPRVCTLQADGHELEMIEAAMRSARIGQGGRVDVGGPSIRPDYENYYGPGRPID